jgi:hypothetical protein
MNICQNTDLTECKIFEYLREFVTARSHTVNRKNQPITTVEGCARLIFASNKADNLKFENYNAQAREALAERLLCIYPGKDAQDFLANIPRTTKESWVAEGIAKHALWLRDNLEITYTGRLLVEGNGGCFNFTCKQFKRDSGVFV